MSDSVQNSENVFDVDALVEQLRTSVKATLSDSDINIEEIDSADKILDMIVSIDESVDNVESIKKKIVGELSTKRQSLVERLEKILRDRVGLQLDRLGRSRLGS